MKVYVYWNLHKHTWSIRALQGPDKGRVIKHSDRVDLLNVWCSVSESGRQRVLRDGRKNVHAGLVGQLQEEPVKGVGSKATYNPYKGPTFVRFTKDGVRPVSGAKAAQMVKGDNGEPVVLLIDPVDME